MAEAEAGAAGQQSTLNSFLASRRAIENLLLVERAYWEQGATFSHNWLASPLATNVATIPEQWLFATDLPGHRVGPNLLTAGDCENVSEMTQAGWRLYQHPTPGATSELILSTKTPKIPKPKPPKPGEVVKPPTPAALEAQLKAATAAAAAGVFAGNASIHLKARPAVKDDGPAPVFETAPLWLTTPPVSLAAGSLVWVHGWARMLQQPIGNADGFLILESIGGEALAERFAPDARLERRRAGPSRTEAVAGAKENSTRRLEGVLALSGRPDAGPFTVTFALCGLGDVWLDELSVQVIERSGPLPPVPANATAPDWLRIKR